MRTLPGIEAIEAIIGIKHHDWFGRCHEISLKIVHSGALGEPGPRVRVVRGSAGGYGIGGQHSWICLGAPYEPDALYLDYTAHCWGRVEGLVATRAESAFADHQQGRPAHTIHGYNPQSIWRFGRPSPPKAHQQGFVVEPLPGQDDEVASFLSVIGPLTREGWGALCEYPQGAWPYREVAKAAYEQVPELASLVPIDILSMKADLNIKELYW